MPDKQLAGCATCGVKDKVCRSEEGKGPEFCPTLLHPDTNTRAKARYARPELAEFARQASIQEGVGYINREAEPYVLHPCKTRVQEVCEFAQRMGYKRLGLAFCTGLRSEARALAKILTAQGFELVSAVCKVGAEPKESLGLKDEEKVRVGGFEAMCNPIAQAMILNQAETDFNVVVGLCVGHDSLFFQHSEAPVTVLVAKDRVLGHNPVAALYTSSSYYSRLTQPGMDDPDSGLGGNGGGSS